MARALPVNTGPSVLASATPAIPAPTAAPANPSDLATCAVSTTEAVWSRAFSTSAAPYFTNSSYDGWLSLQPSWLTQRYAGP